MRDGVGRQEQVEERPVVQVSVAFKPFRFGDHVPIGDFLQIMVDTGSGADVEEDSSTLFSRAA